MVMISIRQLVQRKASQLDNQFIIRIAIKQSLLFCPLCTLSIRRSCICPSESMYHVNVIFWSKVSIIYHMSVFSQIFRIYLGCIVDCDQLFLNDYLPKSFQSQGPYLHHPPGCSWKLEAVIWKVCFKGSIMFSFSLVHFHLKIGELAPM